MAFRTRRQSRYATLYKAGFLPFEARPFSRIPLNVPYVKQLIMDRANDIRVARKMKVTREQYEDKIKSQYRREGWLKKDRAGKIAADPWKMLRAYEDRYRQKNPEYESPWEPRGRKFKDFVRKIERTMAKQRGFA